MNICVSEDAYYKFENNNCCMTIITTMDDINFCNLKISTEPFALSSDYLLYIESTLWQQIELVSYDKVEKLSESTNAS